MLSLLQLLCRSFNNKTLKIMILISLSAHSRQALLYKLSIRSSQHQYRLRIFVLLVAQSCLTLCDSIDCSPPGSSLSMEFSRQEHQSGLPFPSTGKNSYYSILQIRTLRLTGTNSQELRWDVTQAARQQADCLLPGQPVLTGSDHPGQRD